MKKFLLLTVLTIALSVQFGCSKSSTSTACTNATVESEDAKMLAYISANNITATKHSSGMYYQVITPGTGVTPTSSSRVFVRYSGYTTDNKVFDSQTDATKTNWVLATLIAGWQIGIPLIKPGGKIKLVVPSAYAYGCAGAKDSGGNVVIPANSILVFDIELVDVQ
jgi:FKBP-type peptidyl-prolyl cis-trans isomerase FkpA